ncbi:MAG: hypothetical protein JF606_08265 [Burkholderiales bacterium]|jgi:hypothetical protein|nr:hypothetical protein [Burkholderiales bacterium]
MTALTAEPSILSTLLPALGPSQNQRLLRLHTPLGANVLLAERMTGSEAIGPGGLHAEAGFRFEVLAISTNAHLQLGGPRCCASFVQRERRKIPTHLPMGDCLGALGPE